MDVRYLQTRIKDKLWKHDALWAFDVCWVQFLMNGKWAIEADGGWIFG